MIYLIWIFLFLFFVSYTCLIFLHANRSKNLLIYSFQCRMAYCTGFGRFTGQRQPWLACWAFFPISPLLLFFHSNCFDYKFTFQQVFKRSWCKSPGRSFLGNSLCHSHTQLWGLIVGLLTAIIHDNK